MYAIAQHVVKRQRETDNIDTFCKYYDSLCVVARVAAACGSACVIGQYITQPERRFHQPIQRLQLIGVVVAGNAVACPKSVRQCFLPRYHDSAKEAHIHLSNYMHSHTHTIPFQLQFPA